MPRNRRTGWIAQWLEYRAACALFACLRWLPRKLARRLGAALAALFFRFHRHWRDVAEFNLQLAFPEKSPAEREQILRSAFRHWGWLLAEFARFPLHSTRSIEEVIVYDGLENYLQAAARGKGVIFLTAHLGAWELSSFSHSLHGYPLVFLNRPLDNPRVDALVNRYRCLGGNRALDRHLAARAVLEELRRGGAVGLLLDQNVLTSDGNLFVDFFGLPASTTPGPARLALHTDAAVIPGFALWEEKLGKYRLRFEPALELIRTGDRERDVAENTARFTRVIEDYIRRYPEQWLWIHRRWMTRPPGEARLYPF